MGPARLGPLFVEAARRDRRDRFAVGRDANEMRGARSDLHGDDLSVAARVGVVEAATEGDLPLAAVALNVESRSLLIRVRVVDLREEERAVAEWNVRRLAVAAPDVCALAGEIHLHRGEALLAARSGVDDRRVGEPARHEDVGAE